MCISIGSLMDIVNTAPFPFGPFGALATFAVGIAFQIGITAIGTYIGLSIYHRRRL